MTDNEIIKALECKKEEIICAVADENKATHFVYNEDALDLINRLQAENERLKNAYKQCAYERDVFLRENPVEMALLIDEQAEQLKTAKAEAYKECIEKVKDLRGNYTGYAFDKKLDNLLKEMVGEDNGNL